jgi:hypothetical protein
MTNKAQDRRFRLIRRIRLWNGIQYGEWHRFGTRREMEMELAREIARCLRAIAVDGRYHYAIIDTDGQMVEDETGAPVKDLPAVALAS